MPDLKTTDEVTRTIIDGSEFVRLATPDNNWKATVAALRGAIGSHAPYVYLSDFGVNAGGNTVTQNTTALNAAFASLAGSAGTIIWDVGFVATNATIHVGVNDGSSDGTASFISCVSDRGDAAAGISYQGPTNGIALYFHKNKYFYWFGINVNNLVAKATTVGWQMGGTGGASGNTQCLGGTIMNCTVGGFHFGIAAGDSTGCVSEVDFIQLTLGGDDTGLLMSGGFNTLDLVFVELSMGDCGIGIDTGSSENLIVLGGSASGSTICDFNIAQGCRASIVGYRDEAGAAMARVVNGANLSMRECKHNVAIGPNFTSVFSSGGFGEIDIQSCKFDGSISMDFNGNTSSIHIENSECLIDPTTSLPITIPPNTGSNVARVTRCHFRNNFSRDSSNSFLNPINDFIGSLYANNDNAVIPGGTRFILAPTEYNVVNPINTSLGSSFAITYPAYSNIRHLSEAPIIGAANSAATAGTSNTGSLSTGKNLRCSGTFANSATLNFTFVRSVSCTFGTVDELVVNSTAAFLPTDAGKRLRCVGHGNGGQADLFGTIVSFVDSSHLVYIASYPQSAPLGIGPFATLIGEDEPDANYIVTGIVGNATSPESYSVTAQTTSGITFKSSNATSTATVNFMIVR